MDFKLSPYAYHDNRISLMKIFLKMTSQFQNGAPKHEKIFLSILAHCRAQGLHFHKNPRTSCQIEIHFSIQKSKQNLKSFFQSKVIAHKR